MHCVLSVALLLFFAAHSAAQPGGPCNCTYLNSNTHVMDLSGFEPVTYGTDIKKGVRTKFRLRYLYTHVLEGLSTEAQFWHRPTGDLFITFYKSVNMTGEMEINLREGEAIVVSCHSSGEKKGHPIWEPPKSTLPDAVTFKDIVEWTPFLKFADAKQMRISSADVQHEGVYHCKLKDHRPRTLKIRVTHTCSIPSVPNGKLNNYIILSGNKILYEVTVGSKIKSNEHLFLSCDKGYEPLGKPKKLAKVKCSNGIWTDVPMCEPASCKTVPPGIDHGRIKRHSEEHSSNVVYECEEGYVLKERRKVQCLFGEWEGTPPECKDTSCKSDPPGIDHGRIKQHSQEHSSNVVYECEEGFILKEREKVQCLFGEWEGTPPECQENTPLSHNTRFCSYPGIPNSEVSPKVEDGQVRGLYIFCHSGYELKGPEVLMCLPNGMWSNALPTCEPLSTRSPPLGCPRPEMDPNAYIDDTLLDRRSNDPDSYLIGSSVRFQCEDGFQLSGEDVLYCLNTGSWNKPAPVCDRKPAGIIYCEDVEPTAHGRVDVYRASSNLVQLFEYRSSNKIYPVGTQLHYRCNEGYHMKGSDLLECEPFGDWSDNAPTCEKDISCPVLVIRHGGFIADMPRDVRRVPNRNRYPEKTTLGITCNTGYALRGAQTLNCTPSGVWSDEPPVCIEDCGVSPLLANKRLGFGSRTTTGDWPWMVAISRPDRVRPTLICGGALLDARTVLTAAHCFENKPYYILQFGKYHRSNAKDDDGVVVRQVPWRAVHISNSSDIVVHPGYVPKTFANDIALVRLNISVPYNDRILPICLPSPETTEENLQPGNQGYIAGWGMDEMDVSSDELMTARLPVVSATDCEDGYRRLGVEVSVDADRFCAGSRQAGGPNGCLGDSGSPLVFHSNATGKFTAEGIVSHSVSSECARTGRITRFMKIAHYMDWIHENWKRTEP